MSHIRKGVIVINNLGNLIAKLRKDNNITQDALADSISCSRSYISYLERNQRALQPEYCTPLSKVLNFNLKQYLHSYHKYKSIDHYILVTNIIELLNDGNFQKAKSILKNNKTVSELSYGSAYIIKVYCSALVSVVVDKDYISSEKAILKLLNIKSRRMVSQFTPDFSDEERYYSAIILLSNIFANQKEYKHVISLLSNTIDFLEKHIFDKTYQKETINIYFRKLYVTAYNNYADAFFNLKEYSEALKYCNVACTLVKDYELNHVWEMVLKLRIEILYMMDKIDEAQEVYNDFKTICRLKEKTEYFHSTNNVFITKYPKLFI